MVGYCSLVTIIIAISWSWMRCLATRGSAGAGAGGPCSCSRGDTTWCRAQVEADAKESCNNGVDGQEQDKVKKTVNRAG